MAICKGTWAGLFWVLVPLDLSAWPSTQSHNNFPMTTSHQDLLHALSCLR
jgi:hypothetical protein